MSTWPTPDRRAPADQEPAPPLKCTGWTRRRSGTLLGFADLLLPRAGMTLLGCACHQKPDGSRWCSPPAREIRGSDGRRTGWQNVVEFSTPAARRAWSDAAVAAVEAYLAEHPEADQERGGGGRGGWEW